MALNIKSKFAKLLIPALALILLAVVGCAMFQDAIVPAYIDNEAIEYSEQSGKSIVPYTTLLDAKRIKRYLDQKHKLNQLGLARLIEDDDMTYRFISRSLRTSMRDAEAFQRQLFSPTGPISLLAASAGLGLGAMAISKPGDKKKIVALEKTNGNGNNLASSSNTAASTFTALITPTIDKDGGDTPTPTTVS